MDFDAPLVPQEVAAPKELTIPEEPLRTPMMDEVQAAVKQTLELPPREPIGELLFLLATDSKDHK